MTQDERRYKMLKLLAEGKVSDDIMAQIPEPDEDFAEEGFVDAAMDKAIELYERAGFSL